MGYDTQYDLSSDDRKIEEHYAALEEITGYDKYYMNGTGYEIKWYEHENHLKAYSLKYPDTLFTLEGEGEESGDVWKKYFKNGKMFKAKAQITFEEFNEEKLV
jgi:hypothetical protein